MANVKEMKKNKGEKQKMKKLNLNALEKRSEYKRKIIAEEVQRDEKKTLVRKHRDIL